MERMDFHQPVKNMNIRHILVPVDFSEGSSRAIEYAVGIGDKFSSRITLLHVLEPAPPPPDGPMFSFDTYGQAMAEAASKELHRLSSTVTLNMKVDTDMTTGIPWSSIVERAGQGGIDLIVMPTHGRTALKHLVLGSVAERVVQHAPCPVLVVRRHPASGTV